MEFLRGSLQTQPRAIAFILGIGLNVNKSEEAAALLLFFPERFQNLGTERLYSLSKGTQPVGGGDGIGTQVL